MSEIDELMIYRNLDNDDVMRDIAFAYSLVGSEYSTDTESSAQNAYITQSRG